MSEELKPCPFCKGGNIEAFISHDWDPVIGLRCEDCDGMMIIDEDDIVFDPDEREIIQIVDEGPLAPELQPLRDKWNRGA